MQSTRPPSFSIKTIAVTPLAGEVVCANSLATILGSTLGCLLNVVVNHTVQAIEGISAHIDIMFLECSLGFASTYFARQ